MTPSSARQEGELRSVLRKVSRHKSTVVVCVILGMGISWVVLDQTIPRYEAEAQVVLGIRSARIVKFDAVLSDLPAQPAVLRTEMDVITSRAIAERVVSKMSDADKERLMEVSAMVSPLQGLVRTAGSVMRNAERFAFSPKVQPAAVPATEMTPPELAGPPSSLPKLGELVELVAQGVSASNDGQSYTIHIGYSSADPQLAATLANHYARAYIQNQLGSKAEAADRASIWLSQRLVELRHDLEASETAVQNYRHEADILQDKQGTVTAQQLAAINAQLVEARGERIEAEARVATLQSFLGAGGDVESMTEVMSSPVIQGLRDREADLKRKQAESNERYTDLYPADASLEMDLAAIQRQIDGEVGRVAKAIRNGLAAAQAKERALQDELVRLQRRFGEGSDAEVKLQLLQRESDANRTVYEAYLSRLKETTEQGKLQEPDSYLISPAVPPERPSYPRRLPLLFLGTLFGGLTGIAIALFRELFEQRLHSVDEVEEMTGLRVLALVPSLRYPRLFRPENYVLRKPRSLFNESLRTARTAIALSQGDKSGNVIVVTSSIPGEGKTAFCLSLARSLAADHHRVLLIDSDLRRPMVGNAFGTRSERHLACILRGAAELYDSIQIDSKSGAHYITAKEDRSHPQDLLSSERMRKLIDAARSTYDVVILDAPPILVVADAAIVARYADHCVFFIRWGSTARDYVAHALRKLELYNVGVSGIVMSHVNMRRHAHYASGEGYYGSRAHSEGRKLALWAVPRRALSTRIAASQGE